LAARQVGPAVVGLSCAERRVLRVAWELDLGEERSRRDVAIVFGLLTLFAVLVGVTVLGIVLNWPAHRTVSVGSQFHNPKTYGASVVGLQAVRCQAPQARNCTVVTVTLSGGPDKGGRTSFRFGDTGSDAHLELGDKVFVYKNPLPPTAQLGGVKVPPYSFSDFQRKGPLLWLLAVFAVVVLAGGGSMACARWSGSRSASRPSSFLSFLRSRTAGRRCRSRPSARSA